MATIIRKPDWAEVLVGRGAGLDDGWVEMPNTMATEPCAQEILRRAVCGGLRGGQLLGPEGEPWRDLNPNGGDGRLWWRMPIFEYRCRKCGEEFERIVRNEAVQVECPQCGARRSEQLLSRFAVGGVGRRTGAANCGPGGFT